MNATEFETYTERLRANLESAGEVIGLVTLGTTADPNLRDEWSDHDFWVLTKAGAQDSFVEDLSWLPDARNIALTVNHGSHRRTVLYQNGHKVEFAVFDVNEATEGKIQRYTILIDRDRIAGLIQSVHQNTLKQAEAKPDALQNLCVLVWSACERHCRGEFLSARQYLDGFAINQLLSLIAKYDRETGAGGNDVLDPRRRLELRSPELAAEVLATRNERLPEGALQLLEIAERELKQKAPTLLWDDVRMVRGWIGKIVGDVRVE
jgi:lincosamide nucleotidyltransferase B/F